MNTEEARQLASYEENLEVSAKNVASIGTAPSASDEPIADWPEDILDRSSQIEALSFSLLIAKSPAIALIGDFGAGKTSVLNLLRKHLEKRAIVVSFSTWLPGSPDVLASYLLGDISRECTRQFILPGIRKNARKLAKALAETVPNMSAFSDLIPDTTQKEDVEALCESITRLPQRVIVLLDELDRMQKEEVLTVLKIVRGLSLSPNLSFVYAADRKSLERLVSEEFNQTSHKFFEKFLPVSVSLPVLDNLQIRDIGVARLLENLQRRHWFEIDADEQEFKKELEKHWLSRIAPFCTTIRAVGLLVNNIGIAASSLRGEVNPIDLTFIELLKQFEPAVYELVWRHREVLTGGEDMTSPSFQYRTDAEKEEMSKRMIKEIEAAVPDAERQTVVKKILGGMFPNYLKSDQNMRASLFPRKKAAEEDRGISDPTLISAYFRYRLPSSIYSSRRLTDFLQKFVGSGPERKSLFESTFLGMSKDDPRRSNFLDKLSDRINAIDLDSAQSLAICCMQVADKLAYDTFVGFGEAGHVLRIVIRVATRLDEQKRTKFLSACVTDASDDTMAFRIQTVLTKPGQDFDLGIPFKALYPSFIQRMRRKYGPDVNAQAVDLTSSDHRAFNLWGLRNLEQEEVEIDPADRLIQHDFWLRYIGDSRTRLLFAFRTFFMPTGMYPTDPAPFIENKIPLADLKELDANLPPDPSLSSDDQWAQTRLRRLLSGEYASGIGIDEATDQSNSQ